MLEQTLKNNIDQSKNNLFNLLNQLSVLKSSTDLTSNDEVYTEFNELWKELWEEAKSAAISYTNALREYKSFKGI
jgi:predicted choloylglycine hydrolase